MSEFEAVYTESKIPTQKKLKDVTVIFDSLHSTPKYTDHGYPMIRVFDIRNGIIDLSSALLVSKEDHLNHNRKHRPIRGDIIISRVGTYLGYIGLVKDDRPFCLGQNTALISPKISPKYLYYCLISPEVKKQIESSSVGSTHKTLSIKAINELKIPFFSDIYNHAIAHILGTLDDKIELNRRMNETLESIARAIFKSWFIDFDPVRAKADGKQPEGMDAATATLFPSEFETVVGQEIPKGWKIEHLNDVCEKIFSGGTPNTNEEKYWNGDIPWLSSGETRNRFIISTEKTITMDGVNDSSTRFVRKGTTVIASAGQGFTRGQASFLFIDSYINQSTLALYANCEKISDFFLYFDLSGRYEELRQISDSSSSRGSLTTKNITIVKLITPQKQIIKKFDQILYPMIMKINNNLIENFALGELRDILLPKLLSGELPIENPENFIEATA